MNKFKKDLKIGNTNDFSKFDKQVSEKIVTALDKIEPQNIDEQMRKVEMMLNLNKIIKNYDEVIQYLRRKDLEKSVNKER